MPPGREGRHNPHPPRSPGATILTRHNPHHVPDLISIADARRAVLDAVKPLGTERVKVTDAVDRVLAEPVIATTDVPPFQASAMDGYAVQAGPKGRRLNVVGESRAGAPSDHHLAAGEALRISTGAAVPQGATGVIPQEEVEVHHQGEILLTADVPEGSHIRPAGEVMAAGTLVLDAGTAIGPAELAAAIAAGAGEVVLARQPRVRVLSTGDELREPGATLGPGEIHNSNGPALVTMAARCGALPEPPTILPDDRDATEAGVKHALSNADVVIISGGVSVGPHDHVKPALADLGVTEGWWGVALQPGKPTWFGTLGETLVFGLPGNPVSAAVTFSLFVAPALAALQGTVTASSAGAATLGTAVRRNSRREQAIRVRLERRDGALVAIPNGAQGSHVITSLVGADALALIAPGDGTVEPGTTVPLTPLVR
jgi:molybdopterin molybdotransferase